MTRPGKIICRIAIGHYPFTWMGEGVTKDFLKYSLIEGNPAKQIGLACTFGERLPENLVCTTRGTALGHVTCGNK